MNQDNLAKTVDQAFALVDEHLRELATCTLQLSRDQADNFAITIEPEKGARAAG